MAAFRTVGPTESLALAVLAWLDAAASAHAQAVHTRPQPSLALILERTTQRQSAPRPPWTTAAQIGDQLRAIVLDTAVHVLDPDAPRNGRAAMALCLQLFVDGIFHYALVTFAHGPAKRRTLATPAAITGLDDDDDEPTPQECAYAQMMTACEQAIEAVNNCVAVDPIDYRHNMIAFAAAAGECARHRRRRARVLCASLSVEASCDRTLLQRAIIVDSLFTRALLARNGPF